MLWIPAKNGLGRFANGASIHNEASFGWQALHASMPEAAEGARNTFNSCVRTTLLLAGGYECQEKDGIFMLAFHTPRMAIEWSLYLQLGLLR